MQAAERRRQRDAIKHQRELERHAKEMAKLSALEQARVEVETYENALEVLLSVHKEQVDPMDWLSIAATLPPVPPSRQSNNELKARQRIAITPARKEAEAAIDQAKQQDDREYQEALQAYADAHADWEKMSNLARKILAGDSNAYIPAIEELSPFSELAIIGSSFHYTVHNPRLVEVVVSTNGRQAIPTELKTLTASGKVSVKAMPKSRFVEIYQDYVCGCVLRVARELFALLPIESLLISATAEALDTSTGQLVERPFLSVVISRATVNTLNFENLDPSDSVMGMIHRGDLKASRKTGDFEFITPLNVADLAQHLTPVNTDFNTVLAKAHRLRADLAAQCSALNPEPEEILATNGDT
jgi:hypothetical protein